VAVSAWGEAIRAWQAAEAAPQLIQLGNRLIRARNYDQAINAFTATAHVEPRSRSAYEGIARAAHERKATVDEALAELEPLLARDAPTEYGARLQAARELRAAGRFRDAGVQLNRAEELDATPELSFEYGMLWMGTGMPDFAEPLLIRPAADIPFDPENWLWLARAHAEAGRDEQAVATIRQGLAKLDPSGQFAPPAERLPETAAVRAAEIKRSERAPLLGVMGESLIRLGRADEALPALEEAVAAQPKDAWLVGVLAEARRVQAGEAPNLLLNPSFARDGAWALRPINWLEYVTIPTLVNAAPSIADGRAELRAASAQSGALAQDVFALNPSGRYRLAVRLRTEALGQGAVVVTLTPSNGEPVRREIRGDEAAQGITVTLEALPGPPPTGRAINRIVAAPSSSLTVAIGLVAEAGSGAAVWCDEATLTPIDAAR
jgi:tetratricopeptide (TPR) repeat protein